MMPPSASRIASGTVREMFLTSPLGTVAPSMPEKAKIMIPADPRIVLMSGTLVQARLDGLTKKKPIHTNKTKGSNLNNVIVSRTRAPLRTPRMLMPTNAATKMTMSSFASHEGAATLNNANRD